MRSSSFKQVIYSVVGRVVQSLCRGIVDFVDVKFDDIRHLLIRLKGSSHALRRDTHYT